MTVTPLYHFGILVPNLDEAAERCRQMFDLNFHSPSTVRFRRLRDPLERMVEIRAVYSVEGPPHVELIEAVADGLYGLERGLGFHHVGAWAGDIDAGKKRQFDQNGVRSEADVLRQDDSTFSWFSDPASTLGVRYEFVDERIRAAIESLPAVPRIEAPKTPVEI